MPIRKDLDQKREFLSSKKAIIASLDSGEVNMDEELRRLRKIQIKPTYENLEEAFWNDSISVSFTDITSAVIKGDGLRIRLEHKEALQIIKEWCRHINVKRQTVEDWITDTWYDTIVYSKFFWRVDDRSPGYDNVDIQRVDPKTIQIFIDPVMGFRKFKQKTYIYKYHKTKSAFYRDQDKTRDNRTMFTGKYASLRDPWKEEPNLDRYDSMIQGEQTIYIPDEPRAMLFGDFFKKPPIANALNYIAYKRWITWYMRKYSQKHWAPFVILKVGDPKTNMYPTQKHIMQKALDNGKAFLRQITNFGGVAIPGEMDMKTLETNTARSSEIYVLYIKELDKQIMYAIFGSMGQRDATGNELATSRILQEGWLRFIKSIRRKYELILTSFWANCLLPYHGINNVKAIDIEIDWSPLRFESTEELMRSIREGAMIGLWKDKNEMRKAAQPIFSFLEDLPANENEKVEALAIKQAQAGNQKQPVANTKQGKNK